MKSQEIINNGEKCRWLKQMQVADEKWLQQIASGLTKIPFALSLDIHIKWDKKPANVPFYFPATSWLTSLYP